MKNIMSLFDGMSCGQFALKKAGVEYQNYYASEIDKYAMQVSRYNFPNTNYIGDVRNIDYKELPKIDLLIGGSPCQSFSFAGKRKGMATKEDIKILSLKQYLKLKNEGFEFEGQSYLFWEYVYALRTLKPTYFLLENVVMSKEWEIVISRELGIEPLKINSSLLSAQSRNRLYWTNIGAVKGMFGELQPGIPQPKDKRLLLKDVIDFDVDEKYYLSDKMVNFFKEHEQKQKEKGNGFTFFVSNGNNKGKCLTTRAGRRIDDNFVYGYSKKIRRLTPIECERLQTAPDNATLKGLDVNGNEVNISDTQRYKMLGNGWTIDVITYIFNYLQV